MEYYGVFDELSLRQSRDNFNKKEFSLLFYKFSQPDCEKKLIIMTNKFYINPTSTAWLYRSCVEQKNNFQLIKCLVT